MMTVKDVVSVLADATEVRLGYDGVSVPFDHTDKVMLDAFAKYVVEGVYASGENKFEINIAMRPVVAE